MSIHYTLRRIACTGTQGDGTCPSPLGDEGLIKGNVTQVPANAFTININSINGNRLIKAECFERRKP